MTFEVSSMSLLIRRTRNNYLHYDDIWSVINELIDFEGPEKIICTMMTFEV